jgi:hypothetical protein
MIELSYPLGYIFLCAVAGIGYAYFSYVKDKSFEGIRKVWVYLMASLRFLVVFGMAFLLLEPLMITEDTKVEKPLILFAQDNSQSVLACSDSIFYQTNYPDDVRGMLAELSQSYEVKKFSFSNEIFDSLSFDFLGQQTDISFVMDALYNQYYGRNVGAIILASDGIFNKGKHPLYGSKMLEGATYYSIALGDTALRRDLILENILHNKIAFLGNDFPIAAQIKGQYYSGKQATVTLQKDGKIIASQLVKMEGDLSTAEVIFQVEAKSSGKHKYRIQITPQEGEFTVLNNTRDIFIEVLDNKQKILLLAAAPHPDLNALKSAIEKNINYEVTIATTNSFKGDVKGYSLVIAHQVPSVVTDDLKYIQQVVDAKIPLIFMIGEQSSIAVFNNLKKGLTLVGPKGTSDVKGSLNKGFTGFTYEQGLHTIMNDFPPLQIPFASEYKVLGSSQVVVFQKIGTTVTNYPLLLFSEVNSDKTGVWLGEGLWRWRIQNFIKNNNTDLFDQLISKVIQFVVQKEDKSKFRVNVLSTVFENEQILFQGELYNDIFELVNEPDVQLIISDEQGNELPAKLFSRVGNNYRLDAGKFESGIYAYRAFTTFNKNKYEVKGEFIVKPLDVEFVEVVANHRLMHDIASQTGGKLIYPRQINVLKDLLANDNNIANVSYAHKTVADVLRWKWIFYLLLLLISLEWLLRKRNGGY